MKKLNFKALTLPFFVAIIVLLPFSTTAQGSDGFFRANESENYQNRDMPTVEPSGMTLGGYENEDPTAPIGNGLLMLAVAGAGYAIMKRKRSNRASKSHKTHMSYMLALAMVLVFTQCKKKIVSPANDVNTGYPITLTVSCGDDRTSFDPTADPNNSFTWADGVEEYIYVGGSKTVGRLGTLHGTGTGTKYMTFSGTLNKSPNSGGETLYFIYMGQALTSGGRSVRLEEGYPSQTVFYSDQYGSLDSLAKCHFAIGMDYYTNGDTEFNATLNMEMAIAYFDLSEFGTGKEVRIYGDDVFTNATVDFQNGKIDKKYRGSIKTTVQSGGNYIVLCPSTTDATTLKFVSDSKKGEITFLRGIQPRKFYSTGGSPLPILAEDYTIGSDGLLSGEFTVSGSGNSAKKVKFSKGNLQYIGSAATPYWRFADNQWSYLGNNGQGSADENADRDLFGWATSGYHRTNDSINSKVYPWSIGTNASYYANYGYNSVYGYGPTKYNGSKPDVIPQKLERLPSSMTEGNLEYEWGIYNPIKNGGDIPGWWRSLTKDEWQWLVGPPSSISPGSNCRNSSKVNGVENARYAGAHLFGSVYGIILFPDSYTHPSGVAQPVEINIRVLSNWNINEYSADDWSKMETAGCVFLPAAGYRYETTVNQGSYGYYWLGDANGYQDARCFNFNQYNMIPQNTTTKYNFYRCYGCSVRLVRDVN